MLGWTRARLNEAIEAEEFSVVETCGGKRMIEIRELAHYAVDKWPFHVIEKALGREATLIMPTALRTRKITLRLPQCYIQLLEILASENQQSVTKYLELTCDELSSSKRNASPRSCRTAWKRTSGRSKYRTIIPDSSR